MKHCNLCHVDVSTPDLLCPLCGGPLREVSGQDCAAVYPVTRQKHYHFAKRLLLFLSFVAVAVCAVVNYVVTPEFWWWLFPLTGLVYAWVAVLHSMRRGGNGGGKILMQVVCAAAVSVLVDLELGWQGWSLTFCLPIVCGAGIVSIVVLILCNRTNWAGYVIYQVALALLGFVPMVLYFTEVSSSLLGALIPALLATVSFVGLLIFGDKTVKNEFRRRLRF